MKTNFLSFVFALAVLFFLAGTDVFAQPIAFPGAEGSGRFATGGRGGNVYEVNRPGNSGPGSIVDALSTGNRTVVFRISGTIELDGVILEPKSNTTIAGQTAPGDGICIKGRIHLKSGVSDVVIRYVRIRVDEGAANSSGDAIDIDNCNNVIIDHVSASYARDEGISCQETSNNVTVQWCIISEGLTYESHSYGSLVRGDYGDDKTYHHNLYAHNWGRNPRPGNYTATSSDPEGLHFDFRNNVVYNWSGTHPGYNADNDSTSRYNFIGNVYIAGPESSVGYKAFKEDAVDAYAYWSGNAYGASYSTVSVPGDQWSLVTFNGFSSAEITAYKARSYEIPMESVTTTSAAQALTDVLADAGASFPSRDIIDARIVNDVINDTGHSIATTDEQPEGGWPTLDSLPAPTDTDQDGMPDSWETSHGLNPSNAADRNYYDLDADYTNLEVYLNGLVGSTITPPAAPTGLVATAGDGIVWLDWDDNNEADLDGYDVYRSTTSGGPYGGPLNGSLLSSSHYTDNDVNNGTTYYYVVTATDASLNESDDSDEVSASPSIAPGAMGTILREWWTGISGSSVSDLTSDPDFPDNPAGSNQLTCLEAPTDWADSYGTRISGYLHPPASGSYTFWIASDDNSELWLSTNGDPGNATMIANVTGYTDPRQWDKYPSQQSSPISLSAGQKYYIEVLHKEDASNDNLAVAWQGPGISQQVIYGIYLSPWFVGLYGDSTGNGIVDMNDLPDFIAMWLQDDCAGSSAWDLDGDCAVNFYEYSMLAGNWMETEPDTNAPEAPTGLSATPGDGTVSLDWNDNNEADLDGYNVYRSTTSGGPYGSPLNGALLLSSDYTDNSVINGTTYYYVVTAVDTNSNESNYSNEDSATPSGGASSITIQENETGFCGVDGLIESEHAGYTGDGYANTDNVAGNGIDYRINIPTGGTYTFTWRYANSGDNRPAELIVNGSTEVSNIDFPGTGSWTNWSTTSSVDVTLTTGIKDIRLEATGSSGLANIDYVMVTGSGPEVASCP